MNNKKTLIAVLILVVLAIIAVTNYVATKPDLVAVQELESRTYEGVLPCADCQSISTRLTLLASGTGEASQYGTFVLVETYNGTPDGLDGDLSIETVGTWTTRHGIEADSDAVVYVLRPEETTGAKDRGFQVIDGDTIRQLDIAMNPIDSDLPYELELVD
jgi:copper homeostasis protein (lipoprotein)